MKKLAPMLLLAAVGGFALADEVADKKAITAMFAKYDAAFSKRDFATVRKMLAPGAVIVVDGKSYPAIDMMKQSEAQFKIAKKVSVKTTLVSFSFKGDTAVVKTSSKAVMVFPDPQGGKKDATLEDYRTATDTLVRIKGEWRVKKVESKSTKTLMNGKPLDIRPATGRPTPSGRKTN